MTLVTRYYDNGESNAGLLASNRFVAMYDNLEYRTYLYPEDQTDFVIRPINGVIVLEAL